MKTSTITGLVGRHSVSAAGGGMAGAGFMSGQDWIGIAGLAVTVLGYVFSWLEKRKRPKQ
jgi:hypothetical protein